MTILEQQITAKELSALTGVPERTLRDRVADGTIERVGHGRYTLAAVRQLFAYLEGGPGGEEYQRERTRKVRADADMAEHELAVKRKEYVRVEDVTMAWGHLTMALQRNLLNVPGRAVLQLLRETDETTWKQKLKAEIVSALEQNKTDIFTITKENFYDEQEDETAGD